VYTTSMHAHNLKVVLVKFLEV